MEVSDKGLEMHVRGRGRREVRLESAVPVARDDKATRPTWSFALRFPAAAVVRGRIEAPPAVEELDPEGSGLVVPGPPAAAGPSSPCPAPRSAGRSPAGRSSPGGPSSRSASRPPRPPPPPSRARGFQVLGWIEARVAQGRLETLRVPVPAGLEVADVRGPVAGWKVEAGTLVVTPLAPVEDTLAVEIALTGEPQDRFATPLLIPEGSARTTLLAKAALKGDGILSLTDPGAARGPEEREAARLPDSLKAVDGRLFAVADPARPPRWEAAWAERTEVLAAQVDRLLVDVAMGEAGKASYQLWAEVRNRGAQQLTLTLPAGFELAVGHRDGVAVVPGRWPGASLAIPLLTQEAAQVVHLEGVVPLALPQGDGALSVPLPALSAPVARVEVRLILPGGRSYELAEKARAGQVSPPPGTAARKAVSGLGAQANAQINAGQTFSTPASAAGALQRPARFRLPPGRLERPLGRPATARRPRREGKGEARMVLKSRFGAPSSPDFGCPARGNGMQPSRPQPQERRCQANLHSPERGDAQIMAQEDAVAPSGLRGCCSARLPGAGRPRLGAVAPSGQKIRRTPSKTRAFMPGSVPPSC